MATMKIVSPRPNLSPSILIYPAFTKEVIGRVGHVQRILRDYRLMPRPPASAVGVCTTVNRFHREFFDFVI